MNLIKKITAVLCAAALSGTATASAVSVTVNNRTVSFDVTPVIINDRTMVPMRAIFEVLGATVDWNGDTKTVTAVRGSDRISLKVDSPVMTVNDKSITLDTAPTIISDRTLVPVRAISEALGSIVVWDGDTQTVKLTDNSGYVDLSKANKYAVNNAIELLNSTTPQEFNGEFQLDTDNDGFNDLIRFETYSHTNGYQYETAAYLHVNYGTTLLSAGSSVDGFYSAHLIDIDTSDNAKEFLINVADDSGYLVLVRYENGVMTNISLPNEYLYPAHVASVECYGNGQLTINTTKGKKLTYREASRGKLVK